MNKYYNKIENLAYGDSCNCSKFVFALARFIIENNNSKTAKMFWDWVNKEVYLKGRELEDSELFWEDIDPNNPEERQRLTDWVAKDEVEYFCEFYKNLPEKN